MYYIANIRGGPVIKAIWGTGITNVTMLRTLLKKSMIRKFLTFWGTGSFKIKLILLRPFKYSPRTLFCYLLVLTDISKCLLPFLSSSNSHPANKRKYVFIHTNLLLSCLFWEYKYRLYIVIDKNKIFSLYLSHIQTICIKTF